MIGDVAPAEPRAADEVLLTSTAGGIPPVTRLDHRPVGDGELGPGGARLRDLYYWRRHAEGRDATPIGSDGPVD